jgi:hypothetical protein
VVVQNDANTDGLERLRGGSQTTCKQRSAASLERRYARELTSSGQASALCPEASPLASGTSYAYASGALKVWSARELQLRGRSTATVKQGRCTSAGGSDPAELAAIALDKLSSASEGRARSEDDNAIEGAQARRPLTIAEGRGQAQ